MRGSDAFSICRAYRLANLEGIANVANHGGGYSYRLCKNEPGKVSESCFQQTPLRFASDTTQWLQHTNGTKYPIALTKLSVGTTPAGSEWARIPIPGCLIGNCSKGLDPATGKAYPCPEGYPNGARGFSDSCTEFQFPEPLPGLHGFGYTNNNELRPDVVHGDDSASEGPNGGDHFHDYSIVDEVVVPADLQAGDYLLSWRWVRLHLCLSSHGRLGAEGLLCCAGLRADDANMAELRRHQAGLAESVANDSTIWKFESTPHYLR